MKVVFFGTPAFGRTVLERILDAGISVPLAVSQPPRTAQRHGRSPKPVPGAVADFASRNDIPVRAPEHLGTLRDELEKTGPDAFVVASFGRIIPTALLALSAPWVNVHASVLPRYRGASPIPQAILDGLDGTGVSLMQLTEGLDEGPVYATRTVPISDSETAASLSESLAAAGGELLVEQLPAITDGSLRPKPQPKRGISYSPKLTKSSGRIDWSRDATYLERFVRAMRPWPTAWTTLDDMPVAVTQASAVEEGAGAPGEFSDATPLTAATGDGALRIKRIKPAGKAEMAGDDWLRGRRHGGRFG